MIKKEITAGMLALKRPNLVLHPEDIIGASEFFNPNCHSGAAGVVKDGVVVGILTERDLLKKVLAQKLNPHTTMVQEVMTLSPVTAQAESPLIETLEIIIKSGFRYLPVLDKKTFVGIIDVRDLYCAIQGMMEEKMKYQSSLFANMMAEPYGIGSHESNTKRFG